MELKRTRKLISPSAFVSIMFVRVMHDLLGQNVCCQRLMAQLRESIELSERASSLDPRGSPETTFHLRVLYLCTTLACMEIG
jgi:hypothetical protein